MLKTEKKRVDAIFKEMQEDLLEQQAERLRKDLPADFAAGFALGVQGISVNVYSMVVDMIEARKSPAEMLTQVMMTLKEAHQAAHILNSEDWEICNALDSIDAKLEHIVKESLMKKFIGMVIGSLFTPEEIEKISEEIEKNEEKK